ncbi:MAG: F0F1 ATP synthase subunit B [Acidimicrobiia bacterium]
MRTRIKAPLAFLGTLLLVFSAFAGTAFAQEGEEEIEFADHAAEECFELLEQGNTVDDCQESPNPLLPETNEIIWGTLAFLVLLVGMWKWGIPAVKGMMETREERIRTDLERAESAKVESEETLQQYQAQLADARAEAGRIIDEARQSADHVGQEVKARAEEEAREIVARANADIALQRERALAELRTEVADMSISLAERIVGRNLDRTTQMQLVDSFIDEVGSN